MRVVLLEGLWVLLSIPPTPHQPLPPLSLPRVELLLLTCRSYPPPL